MAKGAACDIREFVHAPAPLTPAVASAVGYSESGLTPSIHLGLPSPSLTFIFSLDDPIVSAFSAQQVGGPDASRNQVLLAGMHTRPAYVVQPSRQSGVQLAVRPWAARALFGVPASELSGQVVEGTDVLGASTATLHERLRELTSWSQRFAAVDGYLRRRVAEAERRARPRAEVMEAWRRIARRRGCESVAGLARHVLLSPRQLTAVFTAEFGLTPKAVSRLTRFAHARRRIADAVHAGTNVEMSAVAHACGYFDHSHLVRDFQQYVNASPTQWIDAERRNIQAGGHQESENSVL